jgi:hypothetical protein
LNFAQPNGGVKTDSQAQITNVSLTIFQTARATVVYSAATRN